MLILILLVFGMAIGWLAQLILGRGGAMDRNWTEALVAGVLGSFVGGLLSSFVAGDGLALRPSGFIGSVVGAVIVLAVWGAVRRRA
jgi:uncharacterized membrane protein YeaQ/YmgE (transglycosylase-associated protein family)